MENDLKLVLDTSARLSILRSALLALSFVPLTVKAVSYATIGSYVPALVFGVLVAFVSWGVRRGGPARSLVVRTWSVALVAWGCSRLGLLGLHLVLVIPEAHVAAQFTTGFVFLSLLHVLAGVYFWSTTMARSDMATG